MDMIFSKDYRRNITKEMGKRRNKLRLSFLFYFIGMVDIFLLQFKK
jgi:hypothetical protein